MGLSLETFPVSAAECGPAAEPAGAHLNELMTPRNLVLPATRYQFASVDARGHTVTVYGSTFDPNPEKSLLVTWGLTDGLLYGTRSIPVPDATCDGQFSTDGNTLAIRLNRGFGHPHTGVWVIPLSPVGEFSVPDRPEAIRVSQNPTLRYFVNAPGDRVAVIEAESAAARTRYVFREFQIDFFGGRHIPLSVEPNYDVSTVERLGYDSSTHRFCVIRSERAREKQLQNRLKSSLSLPEAGTEAG